MFSVYILKSIKNNSYYIGHAAETRDRLKKHNTGQVKSTKRGILWKLIYKEVYHTKSEAYKREFEIKSYKEEKRLSSSLRSNNVLTRRAGTEVVKRGRL